MKTNYGGHDWVYRHKREKGECGWDSPDQTRLGVQTLLDFLHGVELPSVLDVLELGCGAGDVSILLAGRGWRMTGVDISPAAIDWARDKAAAAGVAAEFRVADLTSPQAIPDAVFDLVLDGHCLHCIIGEDRKRFLAFAVASLRPGGRLLIDTMCGEPRSPGLREHFDAASRCTIHNGIASRYLGRPNDILRELAEAGLSVVKFSHVEAVDDDQDNLFVLATR